MVTGSDKVITYTFPLEDHISFSCYVSFKLCALQEIQSSLFHNQAPVDKSDFSLHWLSQGLFGWWDSGRRLALVWCIWSPGWFYCKKPLLSWNHKHSRYPGYTVRVLGLIKCDFWNGPDSSSLILTFDCCSVLSPDLECLLFRVLWKSLSTFQSSAGFSVL